MQINPRLEQKPSYAQVLKASSSLFEAAKTGTIQQIERLLNKKVDVNALDRGNCTAIEHAVEHGRADVVLLLLKNKADPNTLVEVESINSSGKLELIFIAIYNGWDDVMRLLLAAHANIEARTPEEDCSPLIVAIQQNKPNIIDMLLNARANVEAADALSGRCIDYAVSNADSQTVKKLIANKAQLDNYWKRMTPLMFSARRGDKEIVRLLLKAKVEYKNYSDDEQANKTIKSVQESLSKTAVLSGLHARCGRSSIFYNLFCGKNNSLGECQVFCVVFGILGFSTPAKQKKERLALSDAPSQEGEAAALQV